MIPPGLGRDVGVDSVSKPEDQAGSSGQLTAAWSLPHQL